MAPPLHLESAPSIPLVFSRSQPLPYFDFGGCVDDLLVRVADYGEGEDYAYLSFFLTDKIRTATPVDNPDRSGLRQPSILRAPEVTLKYPWTSAIDIWTVGCLVRWRPPSLR